MSWRGAVYLSVVGRDKFSREAQAVYEAVFPDAETRLLTWVWPRWIPVDDTARARARFTWLEVELAKSNMPTLIIWGREDEVFDAVDCGFRRSRPGIPNVFRAPFQSDAAHRSNLMAPREVSSRRPVLVMS